MTVRSFKVYLGRATRKYGRFSHEAHLHVSWHMLLDGPALLALGEFRRGLMELAQSSGKADKYHETLTVTWFLLVLERRQAGETWEEFISRHAELLSAELVREFYSAELLRSVQARQNFVAPDLRPVVR